MQRAAERRQNRDEGYTGESPDARAISVCFEEHMRPLSLSCPSPLCNEREPAPHDEFRVCRPERSLARPSSIAVREGMALATSHARDRSRCEGATDARRGHRSPSAGDEILTPAAEGAGGVKFERCYFQCASVVTRAMTPAIVMEARRAVAQPSAAFLREDGCQ